MFRCIPGESEARMTMRELAIGIWLFSWHFAPPRNRPLQRRRLTSLEPLRTSVQSRSERGIFQPPIADGTSSNRRDLVDTGFSLNFAFSQGSWRFLRVFAACANTCRWPKIDHACG